MLLLLHGRNVDARILTHVSSRHRILVSLFGRAPPQEFDVDKIEPCKIILSLG